MSTLGCLDFKLLFTEGYIVAGGFDLSLMYFSFFCHPIPMNVSEFWDLHGLYSLLQFWACSAAGEGRILLRRPSVTSVFLHLLGYFFSLFALSLCLTASLTIRDDLVGIYRALASYS